MCHIAMGKLVLDSTAAVSIWPFEAWKLYQFDVETMLIRCTTNQGVTLEFHFGSVPMSRRKQPLKLTSADLSSFAMI